MEAARRAFRRRSLSTSFVEDPLEDSESPYHIAPTELTSKSTGEMSNISTDNKSNNLHNNDDDNENSDNESIIARWHAMLVWLQTVDGIVAVSFLCNTLAKTLPVLLVPIAVEEDIMLRANYHRSAIGASQVAHITSMAFAGAAFGKFVNGFICQRLGPYLCTRLYLTGLAICSLLFSFSNNANTMGAAYAGMEFCSSVQYASLAILLSEYYECNHVQLASALTALGLASTIGEVLAKLAGTFLAGVHHWRIVSRFGAGVALVGAVVLTQAPGEARAKAASKMKNKPFDRNTILNPARAILGTRKFWVLSLAYSMVIVCACVDRVLVSFYNDLTNLPHNICGGLTLSVTLGLVHGLIYGSETYAELTNRAQKLNFLRIRYLGNVTSAIGLAVLSYFGAIFMGVSNDEYGDEAITLKGVALAICCFLLSAAMASTVAFQFFQLPAMIAQGYGDNKAVCIMWLEAMGYMCSIPTFRALGVLVIPNYGWSAGFGMLAILFALGAIVMLSSVGPVLDKSRFYDDEQNGQQDRWHFFDWTISVYEKLEPSDLCCGGGQGIAVGSTSDSNSSGEPELKENQEYTPTVV